MDVNITPYKRLTNEQQELLTLLSRHDLRAVFTDVVFQHSWLETTSYKKMHQDKVQELTCIHLREAGWLYITTPTGRPNTRIYSLTGKAYRELKRQRNKLRKAHKHSEANRDEVIQSEKCGCFHCLSIFPPKDIYNWSMDGTALCPKCYVDAILGSKSGYPITEEFLLTMRKEWF